MWWSFRVYFEKTEQSRAVLTLEVIMKKVLSVWMPRLALGLVFGLVACGGGGNPDPGPVVNPGSSGAGVVAGIVTDIGSGAPLPGVSVTLVGSSTTVTTDSKGEFVFSELAAGAVNMSLSKTGFAPSYATATIGSSAQTVLVSLKKEGVRQTYNATQAKTLIQRTEAGPYAVIFTAGSLDTTDTNLKVSITPLDPTKELSVLPGDLVTSTSALSAVTFAEFTIYDSSGKKVNLKANANAIVELPIPLELRSQYPLGAKIHCYSYNPLTGKWEDFVEGTVVTSSVDGTTPVLSAQIRHFSWYGGAPQVSDQTCVYVTVISKVTGKPLPGATVFVRPGLNAVTDANGNAKVTTKRTGKVKMYATKTYADSYLDDKGNIIPRKGAKVIEFGKIDEEDNLTGLEQGPCTKSRDTSSRDTRVLGDSSNPIQITTGLAPNGVYEAVGILGTNIFFISLKSGIPDGNGDLLNEEPASGANIVLSDGITQVKLQELAAASGSYFLPQSQSPLTIVPGKRYSVTIDADNNGTVDGNGSANMVGNLAFTNISEGGQFAATGFTPTWTDSASATPGYGALYQLIVSPKTSSQTSTTGYYSGSSLSAALTVIDYSNPGSPSKPLNPDQYKVNLSAFSGAISASNGVSVSDNITGIGISGQLYSLASLPEINISLK
jgi:hypothetical protein